jgi:lipopolysaccharide biosynthesis glycosyltransferase
MTVVTQYVPVVFCFDANYAPYAAVASYSVFRSAQHPVKIYWIATPEAQAQATVLKDHLQRLGMEISILASPENPFDAWDPKGHVSTAGNLRFLIPDLIAESRVIYLDCDILVLSDLIALYQTDMQGCLIGGVRDIEGPKFDRMLRNGKNYINSGVLLMDLDRLREDRFAEKCADIYIKYRDAVLYPDQCVINKFAEDRVVFLDDKWNRMILAQLETQETWRQNIAPGHSQILHFAATVKPWQAWCSPLIADFWWARARALAIPGLNPIPITDLTQAMSLASALDTIEHFREASRTKSNIINHLLDTMAAKQSS